MGGPGSRPHRTRSRGTGIRWMIRRGSRLRRASGERPPEDCDLALELLERALVVQEHVGRAGAFFERQLRGKPRPNVGLVHPARDQPSRHLGLGLVEITTTTSQSRCVPISISSGLTSTTTSSVSSSPGCRRRSCDVPRGGRWPRDRASARGSANTMEASRERSSSPSGPTRPAPNRSTTAANASVPPRTASRANDVGVQDHGAVLAEHPRRPSISRSRSPRSVRRAAWDRTTRAGAVERARPTRHSLRPSRRLRSCEDRLERDLLVGAASSAFRRCGSSATSASRRPRRPRRPRPRSTASTRLLRSPPLPTASATTATSTARRRARPRQPRLRRPPRGSRQAPRSWTLISGPAGRGGLGLDLDLLGLGRRRGHLAHRQADAATRDVDVDDLRP